MQHILVISQIDGDAPRLHHLVDTDPLFAPTLACDGILINANEDEFDQADVDIVTEAFFGDEGSTVPVLETLLAPMLLPIGTKVVTVSFL